METASRDFVDYAVAVVGGGGGIGRQYCLDLARAGAHVLVAGRGDSVERTASEIAALGGTAAPCRADARDGEAIIGSTIKAFGKIDALIVNAGIVRDRSFARMTFEDWQDVLSVHLQGAFACAKAAWRPMVEQAKGKILLTTSGAGLHGRFGQANYATAKAGIIGLTKSLAIEGKPKGICVNAIAPMATTEMTLSVFTKELADALPVASVSPFAMALIHPSCSATGTVLEVGGGWGAAMRWQRSAGIRLEPHAATMQQALDRWSELTDFSNGADYPSSTEESLSAAAGFDPLNAELREL